MPTLVVAAARPYLNALWRALNPSRIDVVTAEFERAVSVAVENQPDLILVASPPIPDALKTCERLLENGSTRNIPISLISLDYNVIDGASSFFLKAPAQMAAAKFGHRPSARDSKGTTSDTQSVVGEKRKKQLLSVVNLLNYAENEILDLNLETSAVLLEATIADLVQNLD